MVNLLLLGILVIGIIVIGIIVFIALSDNTNSNHASNPSNPSVLSGTITLDTLLIPSGEVITVPSDLKLTVQEFSLEGSLIGEDGANIEIIADDVYISPTGIIQGGLGIPSLSDLTSDSTSVGTNGGDGGIVKIHSINDLVIEGTIITGNGSNAQSVIVNSKTDNSLNATGGNGGDGGDMIFETEKRLIVKNTASFYIGNGGNGGNAQIVHLSGSGPSTDYSNGGSGGSSGTMKITIIDNSQPNASNFDSINVENVLVGLSIIKNSTINIMPQNPTTVYHFSLDNSTLFHWGRGGDGGNAGINSTSTINPFTPIIYTPYDDEILFIDHTSACKQPIPDKPGKDKVDKGGDGGPGVRLGGDGGNAKATGGNGKGIAKGGDGTATGGVGGGPRHAPLVVYGVGVTLSDINVQGGNGGQAIAAGGKGGTEGGDGGNAIANGGAGWSMEGQWGLAVGGRGGHAYANGGDGQNASPGCTCPPEQAESGHHGGDGGDGTANGGPGGDGGHGYHGGDAKATGGNAGDGSIGLPKGEGGDKGAGRAHKGGALSIWPIGTPPTESDSDGTDGADKECLPVGSIPEEH